MAKPKQHAKARRQQRAAEADRRGRRVKPTVRDYERVSRHNPQRLAEALIARHNVRMENLMNLPPRYRLKAIESLAPLPILDAAHSALGQPLPRIPVLYTGSWPRDLAWGADSAVAAVRLLLAGQVVGAAVIARQQLERWTSVLAQVLALPQEKGEATADYLARVWTEFLTKSADLNVKLPSVNSIQSLSEPDLNTTDEPAIGHAHAVLSDETEVCPAIVYGVLSEVLHARECLDTTSWDAQGLLRPDELPAGTGIAVGAITDAISLCLIQVGMATAAMLHREGDTNRAALLADYRSWHHRFSQRDTDPETEEWRARPPAKDRQSPHLEGPPTADLPRIAAIMPLAPSEGLREDATAYLHVRNSEYLSVKNGIRPTGRLYRDDELTTLAFDAHRYSAARFAQQGLAVEAKIRGEAFEVQSLENRGTRYILISELAGALSIWTSGTVSEALQNVSSALRSSYWLWLEDDDRSMACLRITLEQSARIMVSINKPSRAEKMESSETPPGRWLEAAGWGRLSPLNWALGQYVHAHRRLDPIGPRLLLDALQVENDLGELSFATARGHALDLVAELAARSALAALAPISPTLSGPATRMLEAHGMDLSTGRLEQILNHAMSVKQSAAASRDGC